MDRSFAIWLKKAIDNGFVTEASCPAKHRRTMEEYLVRDILRAFQKNKRSYICINKKDVVLPIIEQHLATADEKLSTRAKSIFINKDSKVGGSLNYLFLRFRSLDKNATITYNGENNNISDFTHKYGQFSILSPNNKVYELEFNLPIYLIENLESWVEAHKYLPNNAIYLLYEGWLSNKLVSQFQSWRYPELHFSPDYDLVGLQNWLKLRSLFNSAKLHFPDNFEELLKKYPAEEMWKKQIKYLSSINSLYGNNLDQESKLWLEKMSIHGACLEQEALLI